LLVGENTNKGQSNNEKLSRIRFPILVLWFIYLFPTRLLPFPYVIATCFLPKG